MKYLLKNAILMDGSGSSGAKKDILITDKKITKIDDEINCADAEYINCSGLIVAPGFIDAHSHNDFFVTNKDSIKYFKPFIEQGITTQITGNCGFSTFGITNYSLYQNEFGGSLFSPENNTSLEKWTQDNFNKLHLNIAPLVAHGTIKIGIAGIKGQKLDEKQMDELLKQTNIAMEQGAFGGSIGMMYEPGIYSDYEELKKFAQVIAEHDGILTIHPRAMSSISLSYGLLGKPHIIRAFEETKQLVKDTHVRFELSHLIMIGKKTWKCSDKMLKHIKKINDEGFSYGYDIYPYTYGASVITVFLPEWYMKLSRVERNRKATRFKLKFLIGVSKKLLGLDYSDMTVSYIGDEYLHLEGKTIAEIAKIQNKKPIDMYLDLVDISDGKARLMIGKYSNEEIIKKFMQDEYSICMTDAWYESRGTQNGGTYGAFPLFLRLAIDNGIPLENIINKMTFKTAERYQIVDRGLIKEGYFADVTIFDKNIVNDGEEPDSKPQGIKYVFINGALVLKDGVYNESMTGEILKKRYKEPS